MLRVHGEAEARPVTRGKQAQTGTTVIAVPRGSRRKGISPDRCRRRARPPAVFCKQVRGGRAAAGPARTQRGLRRNRRGTHRVRAPIRGSIGASLGRQEQYARAAARLERSYLRGPTPPNPCTALPPAPAPSASPSPACRAGSRTSSGCASPSPESAPAPTP